MNLKNPKTYKLRNRERSMRHKQIHQKPKSKQNSPTTLNTKPKSCNCKNSQLQKKILRSNSNWLNKILRTQKPVNPNSKRSQKLLLTTSQSQNKRSTRQTILPLSSSISSNSPRTILKLSKTTLTNLSTGISCILLTGTIHWM